MDRSKMLVAGVIAAILVVAGIAIAVNSNNTKPESKPTNQTETTPQTDTTAPATETPSQTTTPPADTMTVNVEGGSFYFKPATITVKKGQKVKLVFNSVGAIHDFVIDALNVQVPNTSAGSSNTVEFTPMQTGTFEYYCSIGNHRQEGMVGKLTVQ